MISNSHLQACYHGAGHWVQRAGAGAGQECNAQGYNGLRLDSGGVAWAGEGASHPAAGAKFTGALVAITLISHRFECQTRRFFAIL